MEPKIFRAGIVLLMIFVVVSVAHSYASCVCSEDLTFNVSKNITCEGEKVNISIGNLSKCSTETTGDSCKLRFMRVNIYGDRIGTIADANFNDVDGIKSYNYTIPYGVYPENILIKPELNGNFYYKNSSYHKKYFSPKIVYTSGKDFAVVDYSKTTGYPGDVISLIVSNLTKCDENKFVYVKDMDSGDILASSTVRNGSSLISITIPPGTPVGTNMNIAVYLEGYNTPLNTATLTIYEKPTHTCYDKFGNNLGECGVKINPHNPLLQYSSVKGVSLPLHFTFGFNDSNVILQSNAGVDESEFDTFGFFTTGVHSTTVDESCLTCEDAKCSGGDSISNCLFRGGDYYKLDNTYNCNQGNHWYSSATSCSSHTSQKDEHTLVRNKYKWNLSYDSIVYYLSTQEFFPAKIGVNSTKWKQDSTLDDTQPSECHGNKTCYTDVPFCGDGVCDVKSGERCWNCPQDCATGKDLAHGFNGDCINNGCNFCGAPRDPKYVDPRGCIVEFKGEGEKCYCHDLTSSDLTIGGTTVKLRGLCGADVCAPSFGEGNNVKERLEGKYQNDGHFDYGHCCPPNWEWDVVTQKCEIKSGLIIYKMDISIDGDNNFYNEIGTKLNSGGPSGLPVTFKLYFTLYGDKDVIITPRALDLRGNSACFASDVLVANGCCRDMGINGWDCVPYFTSDCRMEGHFGMGRVPLRKDLCSYNPLCQDGYLFGIKKLEADQNDYTANYTLTFTIPNVETLPLGYTDAFGTPNCGAHKYYFNTGCDYKDISTHNDYEYNRENFYYLFDVKYANGQDVNKNMFEHLVWFNGVKPRDKGGGWAQATAHGCEEIPEGKPGHINCAWEQHPSYMDISGMIVDTVCGGRIGYREDSCRAQPARCPTEWKRIDPR